MFLYYYRATFLLRRLNGINRLTQGSHRFFAMANESSVLHKRELVFFLEEHTIETSCIKTLRIVEEPSLCEDILIPLLS